MLLSDSIPQDSVSIWRSIYTQKLTLVRIFPWMTTAWMAQRNKADLINCSSTTDGKTRHFSIHLTNKKIDGTDTNFFSFFYGVIYFDLWSNVDFLT